MSHSSLYFVFNDSEYVGRTGIFVRRTIKTKNIKNEQIKLFLSSDLPSLSLQEYG